jgi:hypothetical protein
MYTDPSGENPVVVAGIIIGAAIGSYMGYRLGDAYDARGWDMAGYVFCGAVIGGVSGGAAAYVGGAVGCYMTAVGWGGAAGGAVAGAAAGATGGFINGAGMSALNGDDTGNILRNGLIQGGIGAASGAVIGGLAGGISAYRNGGSFWDGSKTLCFETENDGVEKIIEGYDASPQDNELLEIKMKEDFGVSKGDFNLKLITANKGKGFAMTSSGRYIYLESGKPVGGYVISKVNGDAYMHIAPSTVNADVSTFRAIVGHELIHAYHNYTIPYFNIVYSERVAYQYSYNEFMSAGNIRRALSCGSINFSYPAQYQIPYPFRF